jgi:heat shock protein HtpX
MWEAIESNRRRSVILVAAMGVVLVALGFVIGLNFNRQVGGAIGAAGALGLWLILWAVAAFQGDGVMLHAAGAARVEKEDAPQLWNVVEEMTIASGLGKMPAVYVIAEDAPNAFAVGRKAETRAVAVTSGLLRLLNRDELQGVVGHEIGHISNRDTSFMVLAGVMLGAIVFIAEIFLRVFRFGGGGRRRSRGGGQAQLVIFLVAIAFAILAPVVAQILYYACSRRREYLADASSARFTRYPEGLASALEKIAARAGRMQDVSKALAPMYIVNPMQALAAFGLFTTHPPTGERVKILRAMGGGAAFADYEKAFRQAKGGRRACIGTRSLAGDTPLAARGPSVEKETRADAAARSRGVVDFLARLDNLVTFTCACGVGIKVPAGLGRDAVPCPRCGAQNRVPEAERVSAPDEPLRYARRGKGWESFRCSCDHAVQISPAFSAPFICCNFCARKIQIVSAKT